MIEREWGVRGECLVSFDHPHSALLPTFTTLHLGKGGDSAANPEIETVPLERPLRLHGRVWRAKLRGVETPEHAKTYRGRIVYYRLSALPPLEDGNYYWAELIGATAVDETGRRLGTVSHLEGVPGALCLVIISDSEVSHDASSDAPSREERLYPAHPDLIHAFDRATHRLIITDIW